jgi:phosphohistidine phosphatase SixA
MRHADAPGIGDPAGFRLEDCSTQRNLSEDGRRQARAIGDRFRRQGIREAPVYSSRWCRSLETARLLGLGEVTPHPGLDSFFRDAEQEERRTAEAKELIRRLRGGASAVLVTPQVNIPALPGVFPREGEIVVVRADGDRIVVIGRIR